MLKYSGKVGEYRALACLLERDIEAYPAIKSNQADFDITAVGKSGKVVRIQVKTTQLQSQSTNNSVAINGHYDFLVIVILGASTDFPVRFFVLSKSEAMAAKGGSKQLGTSQQRSRSYQVKDVLLQHEDKWDKISNACP